MILVVIPAVALGLLSLASFAGRWVWWLDVLANFRAQYVVALVLFGMVLLAPRRRKIGYGVLAAALVNLVVVAPLYLGSPGPAGPGLPSIRVLNFNLLSTNESYAAVVEYIDVANADLVFLYEASRPWEAAIKSAGLDYEIIRPRSENLIFGTLVLARDEVEAVSFGFAETHPRAVALTYHPDDWPIPVEVLSTHPLAPTSRERADLRDAQLDFAGDWAGSAEGAYFVVGDFNATPWSAPFRRMLATGGLRNSQIGFGLQPSFPATSSPLLRVPIDHLLHSDELVVTDRRLGPNLGSDHFVLIVDLQYNP